MSVFRMASIETALGALVIFSVTFLAGCAKDSITPHVSTNFQVQRNAAGAVAISIEVKNDSNSRATVPLLLEVRAFEDGSGSARGGIPVIHPAAFVLNRNESRKLTKEMNTSAAVLAQLTVKEAERGILLSSTTRTVEAGAATTPAPK